jgi:cytochrome c biogenesis protein ResB
MKIFFDGLLKGLSSSKLALVLVLLVILFSLAGAVLPQEGVFPAGEIARWQNDHSFITALMKPLGFFHVFHSIPFLAVILLLLVNTLTCTVIHFIEQGGVSSFTGPNGLRKLGFVVLHLSLIVLFAGGFRSASSSLDGYIVLTEGQEFREEHGNYVRLVEGPLRKEIHKGFLVRMKQVVNRYEKKRFLVNTTVKMDVGPNPGGMKPVEIQYNHPFTYNGLDFTLDKTGFSPYLAIRDTTSQKILVNSFVALQTFGTGTVKEYKDFLPPPVFQHKVMITLYPSHKTIDGKVVKTGEKPENPVLILEFEDQNGNVISRGVLPFRGSVRLGNYSFSFPNLRQWGSFRISEDPGYPLVWFSIWLGLIGILMRYFRELMGWIRSESNES